MSDLKLGAADVIAEQDILAPYKKQLLELKKMEGIQARMPAEITIH